MGLFSFVKNVGANMFGPKKKKTTAKKTTTKKTTTPKPTVAPKVVKKVKTQDEQMAEALATVIDSLGLEVDNLDIKVKDDAVTVKGTASTHAEKEKIILALGNVAGIATVDDQMDIELVSRDVSANSVFYTVEKGDSLSKIAKQHYGNSGKYHAIFEANKPMLEHPDKIYPGQVLRIPPLAE